MLMRAARWPFRLIQCHLIIKFVIRDPSVFCHSPLDSFLLSYEKVCVKLAVGMFSFHLGVAGVLSRRLCCKLR